MTSSPNKIVLMACGSFSPPTHMHLRLFEIAKDHFSEMGIGEVVGGIVSPVHDAYGKKGLMSSTHRLAMSKLALQSSDWIKLSDWECHQNAWTRTRMSLQYHQNYINSYIKDLNGISSQHIPNWLPDNIKKEKDGPVQIKLLCGGDLLESFAKPGLWADEDIEAILGHHGIVVVSRIGANPEQFIFNSDVLCRYKKNITLVTNWVTNDVSSSLVRRFFSRGLSVKYLVDDKVIDYVKKHGLFGCNDVKYILPLPTTSTNITEIILTPISPESETCNESYVKYLNVKNAVDYESMDETDFTPSPRTPNQLMVDGGTSLHKVFCCAQNVNEQSETSGVSGTSSKGQQQPTQAQFSNKPGHAVQIFESAENATTKNVNKDLITDKVGQIGASSTTSLTHTTVNKNKLSTNSNTNDALQKKAPPPLPSPPRSPAQNSHDLKLEFDEDVDIEKLITRRDSTARVSPSKSYSDLVQFVFTEHGIRVISDREYVV